jgi:thiol-disulfide isomerase/thioredoxin
MTRALTRYGIPALIAIAILAFLWVLMAAGGAGRSGSGLDRFATGPLQRLEFRTTPPEQPRRSFAAPGDEQLTLQDFQGKVVLVNLWATWCAPCLIEVPSLAALQRAVDDPRFVVLPISIDRAADRAHAEAEIARLSGGLFGLYHDVSAAIAFDIQAPGVPLTVLYDAQGRERARFGGDANWASPEAQGLIRAVLAGE